LRREDRDTDVRTLLRCVESERGWEDQQGRSRMYLTADDAPEVGVYCADDCAAREFGRALTRHKFGHVS
jgi:hypothetical protein